MRVFGIVLGVIVLAVIGIPVAWLGGGLVYQTWHSYSHSFRLTLEVDTPDGVKSGSSIIRVTTSEHAPWLPIANFVEHSVRGEAAFVDIGNGRNVIATLGFGQSGRDDRIANLAAGAIGHDKEFWYRKTPSHGQAELTGPLIPLLVSFSDLNGPATGREVNPGEFRNVFGPDVHFKRVWIEMIPSPIWPFEWTRGLVSTPRIEKVMPWLAHMERYRTDPINPFTSTLTFGRALFVRGL